MIAAANITYVKTLILFSASQLFSIGTMFLRSAQSLVIQRHGIRQKMNGYWSTRRHIPGDSNLVRELRIQQTSLN
jgi:hypothetical protein